MRLRLLKACKIFMIFVALLLYGCQGQVPLQPKEYEVHEWGVWIYDAKRKPIPPSSMVSINKPVILFYANAPTSADISISVKNGVLTRSHPHGDEGLRMITWGNLSISEKGCAGALFVPPSTDYWFLNIRDIGTSCVVYDGIKEKFVFYEGNLEYKIPIEGSVSIENGEVVFKIRNIGKYSLYNLFVIYNDFKEFMRSGEVYYVYVDRLIPSYELIQKGKKYDVSVIGKAFKNKLAESGLSKEEVEAFCRIWEDPIFYKTDPEGVSVVVYQLPEKIYSENLQIDFNPKPKEIKRVGIVVVYNIPIIGGENEGI